MLFDPRRAIAAALLAIACTGAQADSTSVRLEDLTSPELADAIRRGRTTVIVPIGGTEQNGPHIVLGKHNRRADALSQRIAKALGDALVAPVIAYVPEGAINPPTGHMRHPGTISIPSDVFVRTLESAANSLRRHGFRDVVFLGDHGGYRDDVRRATARLNRDWAGTSARAHAPAVYYESAETGMRERLLASGFDDAEIGLHAGLADTSLTLAVDASLVRTPRMLEAPGAGVVGDPRRASAALGEAGVSLIVTRTATAIRNAVARR